MRLSLSHAGGDQSEDEGQSTEFPPAVIPAGIQFAQRKGEGHMPSTPIG